MNGTNWASNGIFAFTAATGDTQPPTQPGKPSGTSTTTSSIDLTWQASTDNTPGALTYRVYRDGNPTPIAQVSSASTTTVGYHDDGLVAGSTHTYRIDARDAAGGTSTMSPVSIRSPCSRAGRSRLRRRLLERYLRRTGRASPG